MSEMIDRVAKAAHDSLFTDDKWSPSRWPETNCSVSADLFRQAARAAIKAMREPTEAMVVAAMVTPYPTVEEAGGIVQQGNQAVRLEWQAMIDAALEP